MEAGQTDRETLIEDLTALATQRRLVVKPLDQRSDRPLRIIAAAIDVLTSQSDQTPLLLAARQQLGAIDLETCTPAGAALNCSAVIRLQPDGRETFPYEVLLFQTDRTAPATFTVKFFEEIETPANRIAYLVSEDFVKMLAPPKSLATLSAVAGIGGAIDPFYEPRTDPLLSLNCPTLCEAKPYEGGHKKHYTGSGTIKITQTFGNLLDGTVNVVFKNGDLGGGAKTVDVALDQYQFRIFSEQGLQFHYGKFGFAAPSAKIAISESGEGFRFLYNNLAFSHISKRESAAESANRANRDSEVWLAQWNNIDISSIFPFRNLSMTFVDGRDRKPVDPDKPHPVLKDLLKRSFETAHDYRSYGAEMTYAVPRIRIWGSVSAYRSERQSEKRGEPCGRAVTVCDGRGEVALITMTKPVSRGAKVTRTLTASFGIGSADNAATPNLNEGYIGENPGYAPDQIFLAGLAGATSGAAFFDPSAVLDPAITPEEKQRRLDEFALSDIGVIGLGPGLSNKRYIGLKYVDENFSLLETVATALFFVPKSDIKSRATRITLNDYRLRSKFLGSKEAGREIDIAFEVETPKGVKVSLNAGYFQAGSALDSIVKKNIWTVSSLISLSL